MKKLIIAMGLLASGACPCIFAQETVSMKARVPFAFRMGDETLPSGTYLIQASGSLITLRTEAGKAVAVSFLSIPESRNKPESNGKLLFNRYGNECFLESVWGPDSLSGRSLPKTQREKELASRAAGTVQVATVGAK